MCGWGKALRVFWGCLAVKASQTAKRKGGGSWQRVLCFLREEGRIRRRTGKRKKKKRRKSQPSGFGGEAKTRKERRKMCFLETHRNIIQEVMTGKTRALLCHNVIECGGIRNHRRGLEGGGVE